MKRKKVRKDPQPAPGGLRIVQTLLETIDPVAGSDELASPWALTAWLQRHGLLDAGVELDSADLERVLRVRQGWRALLDGPENEEAILQALEQTTAAVALRVRHGAGGVVRFEPAASGIDGALGRLLLIAREAQADGTWRRLKVCASPTCRAVFYDRSTNHTAKWCRPRCGNRISSRLSKRRSRLAFRDFQESQRFARFRLQKPFSLHPRTHHPPTREGETDE